MMLWFISVNGTTMRYPKRHVSNSINYRVAFMGMVHFYPSWPYFSFLGFFWLFLFNFFFVEVYCTAFCSHGLSSLIYVHLFSLWLRKFLIHLIFQCLFCNLSNCNVNSNLKYTIKFCAWHRPTCIWMASLMWSCIWMTSLMGSAGNSCYFVVQTLLSSRLLSKNLKIKIFKQ